MFSIMRIVYVDTQKVKLSFMKILSEKNTTFSNLPKKLCNVGKRLNGVIPQGGASSLIN